MAKASPGRGGSAKKAAARGGAARGKAPGKQAAAKKAGSGKADAPKAKTGKVAETKAAAGKRTAGKTAAAVKPPPPVMPAAKTQAAPKAAPAKTVSAKTPLAKQSGSAKKSQAKASAPAKTVAVTKAAPRRPKVRIATPIPAPRRGRPAAAARKAPPASRVSHTGPQVFTVSHLQEADFKADGLRPYALYRDLGIAAATSGLARAHVIRFVPPCTDAVRKRHVHRTDLQLVYVLQGWIKNEFEGHGEQMMSTGSCWLQPSGIEHTVLDYSPDCEVLEIIVPADFSTEDVG
jgi:uncharacterized RmlC-like cupin family protein